MSESPNKTKHTPGPWEKLQGNTRVEVRMPNGERLAVALAVAPDGQTAAAPISRQEQMANARLIAAAPELLEALKAVVDHLPSIIRQLPYGVPMAVSEAHDNARAIIAKAEGGPNV